MHQFYDKVPVGICVLAYIPPKTKGGDYDFRAVYVNHQFEKIMGCSAEYLIHSSLRELNTDNEQLAIDALVETAFYGREAQMQRYDNRFHKYLKATCLTYQTGYAMVVLQDITNTKFQMDAFESISNAYREILYIRLDENYYQMVYPQTRNSEQGDFDEILEKHLAENRFEAEEVEQIRSFYSRENMRKMLTHENCIEHKYRRSADNTSMEWVLGSVTAIERENGVPKTIVLSVRSVEEVVKADEEKRQFLEKKNIELQEKMEIINSLGNIYYALYQIDLEKDTYKEIKSVEQITRYIPGVGVASDNLKVMCDKLILADYNDEMRKFSDLSTLRERLKNTDVVSHEFISFQASWNRANFIAVHRDHDGNVTHVLYATQHIDAEKQKELDYQRNLEEAVELAKHANMARNKFLSSMSHDIRTPINGILGMISKDTSQNYSENQHQEHMKKIRASAEQLLAIMTDVLEMSKLESGICSIETEPFVLKDIITYLQEMEMPNGIKMQIQYDVKHEDIIGSQVHIRQILEHIIKNAIKYSKNDGIIDISLIEKERKNNHSNFEFKITDYGIGMSQEFVGHIFEPFTQEHGNARTTYEGTGLGMAIVKRLVEEMNGTIEVKSQLEKGTVVTVLIPLQLVENNTTEGSEEDECQNVNVSGMTALLVEDNEINMEIAQYILESASIRVIPAENGKVALDTFEHSKVGEFDMILMDIMMPVMDGLQAAKEIRALDREDAKEVPIIAVTANTFPEDVKKSLDAGMNEHVGKPLDGEILINTIKKCKKNA